MKRKRTIVGRLRLAFLVIMLINILISGFLLVSNSRGWTELFKIEADILPDTLDLIEIEMALLEVEMQLIDVAATRAAAGYDSGYTEASTALAAAESIIIRLVEEHRADGEDDMANTLQEFRKQLQPYYLAGRKMVEGYVAVGLDEGNQRRDAFYSRSEAMIAFLEGIVRSHERELAKAVAGLKARMRLVNRVAGIATAAGLLFALIVAFSITRSIRIPVSELRRSVSALADGDLQTPPHYSGANELGEVCDSLRRAEESLTRMILEVREQTGLLSEKKDELGAGAEQAAAAVTEISGTIASMSRQIGSLDGELDGAAESSGRIAAAISQFGELVETLASVAEESSAATNETVAQVKSVSRIAGERSASSLEMGRLLEAGGAKVDATHATVEEVARSVDDIQGMLGVINKIAAQTNLLSMNAAIEAAHAGEAGRGFSVVAAEIRTLAEESGKNAKNISGLLKGIVARIAQAASTSEESTVSFGKLKEGAALVADSFVEIERAMAETAAGSDQVLSALGRLNDLAASVRSGTAEIDAGVKETAGAMERVRTISASARTGMEEMGTSATEIDATMSDLRELAQTVQRAAEEVQREIDRFTVGEGREYDDLA